MARKLVVEIVGDASSLQKTFKQADQKTSKFGSSLGALAKTAGIAGLALGGVLAVGLKKSIDSANEHAVAFADTNAVLKSTGRAANVTAKQVAKYADSIEKMSGLDDIAIQKGENMLLTFTNIRNETGKGNDIFKQATDVLADLTVKFGGDTSRAAVQLGKALNDPIRGITALTRVGVTFSAGQRKTIKALVAGGKTAEAQKIILAELRKEFGGQAKAYGRTLPGQMKIFQARLDDIAQTVGQKLIPVLAKGLKVLSDLLEIFQGGGSASEKFQKALERLGVSAKTSARIIDDLKEAFNDLRVVVVTAFNIIRPILAAFVTQIRGIVQLVDDLIHGRWSEVWGDAVTIVRNTVSLWKTILTTGIKTLGGVALKIGKAIGQGILDGLKNLAGRLIALIIAPINALIRQINRLPFVNIPEIGGGAGGGGKPAGNRGGAVPSTPTFRLPGQPPPKPVTGPPSGRFSAAGVNINGPMTVVANDPDAFLRELQKKARTKSASRTGRFGGNNLGLA